MKRRKFLKILALVVIGLSRFSEAMGQEMKMPIYPQKALIPDSDIKDYLSKMKNFNKHYKEDIRVSESEYPVFTSTVKRLRRLQAVVGHGNFQLLNFDESLRYAKNYSKIGPFTKEEAQFIEKIFHTEAVQYGFNGGKTFLKLTEGPDRKNAVKIPYSGNYILKGEPLETYKRIKKQIEENIILTSGIRGIIKQFLLFLNKAYANNGNLSLASRSLAPPGYSYHGNGDFDVGQVDLGSDNFTERFTETKVYHSLKELGYLKLRYHSDNSLGVRFEPWHIKVV